MKQWVSCMNVGPWFYLERWGGMSVYRARVETEIAAAMAFSGHT